MSCAARLPSPAARISAVAPSSVVANGSAPASARMRIASASAVLAATMNVVVPTCVSRPAPGEANTPTSNASMNRFGRSIRAFGSAPAASMARSARCWRVAAATCNAV